MMSGTAGSQATLEDEVDAPRPLRKLARLSN
jgi:hypothetical protein